MKIAIVVQGRFHAFELARALLAAGHQVTVFTNYPAWAAARLGLDPRHVRGFSLHGALTRVLRSRRYEPFLTRLFGLWAARAVWSQDWDLVHIFSTAAEEILQRRRGNAVVDVMRGCSHICTQDALMSEEAVRCGMPVGRPLPWTLQRELREYALADRIVALSRFAALSFLEQGVDESRVACVPLAAELEVFAAPDSIVRARAKRILANDRLRVLFVGSVSYRKGAYDLLHIAQTLDPARFEFCAVGDISISSVHLEALRQRVQCTGRLPYHQLPDRFAWGDVFVFPTIEDGFAVVLAQALAAGLPVLTTANSGGPDLIVENGNGWILPIRDPAAFIARLQQLECNRQALADQVLEMSLRHPARSWQQVVDDLLRDLPRR